MTNSDTTAPTKPTGGLPVATHGELTPPYGFDATAARRVKEGNCQYGRCNQPADYEVAIQHEAFGHVATATTLVCRDCSDKHGLPVASLLTDDFPEDVTEGEDGT